MLLLLTGDDAMSYQELSERLGMPIGSIGPTRARALQKLRVILEEMDAEDRLTDDRVRASI
jgi:DNA-directed RNA polymerase specialized sigma24 family protein